MQHRRAEAARQIRTMVIVVLAGAIANICHWFYRESGGTRFFLPMLVLHAICVSIGVLINRRFNANQTARSN
ncbi:hypothetical protein SH449x_004487 [Pirellulaceae bacterium SH449]